jgi:hypothetical protein
MHNSFESISGQLPHIIIMHPPMLPVLQNLQV